MATKAELLARLDAVAPGHGLTTRSPKDEITAALYAAEIAVATPHPRRERRYDRTPETPQR